MTATLLGMVVALIVLVMINVPIGIALGVMAIGEYTFCTAKPEEMTVITGSLKVLIPGSSGWEVFKPGETFYIPGESEFNLQVAEASSYLCKYLS